MLLWIPDIHSCNSRAVCNRYEAVGDPLREEGLDPELRFVWVLEKGKWVEKGKVLEEKRNALGKKKGGAGRLKGKKNAGYPRATRITKNPRAEEEVKQDEGPGHPVVEGSADHPC